MGAEDQRFKWIEKAMPQVRVVPIIQLILDEKNANKGTKRGRELLEKSLGDYGAGRSVVVDRKPGDCGE